uniref:ABC transporter permease n=2 Tax=Ignisphaera aggregans TaxID=334771 RepID=A0A7C5THR4_9CREN
MGFKDMVKDKMFIAVLSIVIGIVLYIVIYTNYFIKIDPSKWYSHPQGIPPSSKYPFGTTLTGQNLADLVPTALKNSIVIGITTALTSTIIAITLAALVTIARKGVSALMIFIDTMCTIPPLPILIVMIFTWRDYITMPAIGLILSIFGWAWPSRALISTLSSLKERTFIYTSYLSGLPSYMIMFKDFMPFIMRYILVGFINLMLWAIGMETTISMFGAMKMETPTIGTTLYWALQYQAFLLGLWWWYLIPVLFLIALVLPLYMIGIKIDEYLTS